MSICRGCGKKILWVRTLEGKRIPLDPVPPVYRSVEIGTALDTDGQFVERAKNSMVSHFVTCANANDFSSSKKDAPGGTE